MSINRAAIRQIPSFTTSRNDEPLRAATGQAATPATPQPDAGTARLRPASYFKRSRQQFFPSSRPAPPALPDTHWSRTLDLSNVNFPNDVEPPNVEDVKRRIAELLGSSGQIRKRYSVGAGLYFHKPSSPRYQIAKREMSATERTQLTAILRHLINQNDNEAPLNSVETDEVVDLYLAVQHARLRTHTPEERSAQRWFYAACGVIPLAFPYAFPLVAMKALEHSMRAHRNYYRNDQRMEYQEATNDMFEMLASPDCAEEVKLKIAAEILDHYMSAEKLLSQRHADSILMKLNNGEAPEGTGQDRGMNGEMRSTRMASIVLQDRSTEEQRRQLIDWTMDASNWQPLDPKNPQEEPLDKTLERLVIRINKIHERNGFPPLTLPANLKAWNQNRNAEAFARLLRRAEQDVKYLNSYRSDEVYDNIASILDAVMADSAFADDVFNDSVAGTQACIENVIDYISKLATKSKNRQLVRQVVSGKMNLEQFKNASLAHFRLETLDIFIAQTVLPQAIRNNKSLNGIYEVELAQVIKTKLRGRLDLPDTVIPSSAEYPGKWRWHNEYVRHAEAYVREYTENQDNQRAFLDVDTLWRDGIIALVRQLPHSQDVNKLRGYTLELSNYTWNGSTATDQYGQPIKDKNLASAVRAASDLERLYTPKTGQKVSNASGKGKDKYLTEIAAFQDLYDRIEKLEEQFRVAIQSVERKFASHVADYVVNDEASFPPDGNFQPDFALPEYWEQEMHVLLPLSQAAELIERSKNLREREKDIQRLNEEINRFIESGNFIVGDSETNNIASLDGSYRSDLVNQLRNHYGPKPGYSANFDLRAYLEALPKEVASTLAPIEEVHQDLILLRSRVFNLCQAEYAFRMSRQRLGDVDASVLEQAQDIMNSELESFTEKLFSNESPMDFAPFTLKQMKAFSANLKDYYQKPDHWNDRFNLNQFVSRQLSARSTSGDTALQRRDGKNDSPAWNGEFPSALVKLRDKYWAVAQTRHECEEARRRLRDLPSLPDGGKDKAPSTPVLMQSATHAFSSTSSARLSLRLTVRPDRKATAAIPLLDQYFSSNQWEGMEVEDPGIQNYSTSYGNTLAEDFDPISGAPTEAYVSAMTKNAQLAKQQLKLFGLTTGEASAAGMNCLIHSMLAGVGITDNDTIGLAQEFRTLLIACLREKNERLGEAEFLNSFGSHPANLIDLINEYFPEADVGVRIYTPLPGGGLLFNNPESVGGTGGRSRKNAIAVMWVGNHYEPIQTIGPDAI